MNPKTPTPGSPKSSNPELKRNTEGKGMNIQNCSWEVMNVTKTREELEGHESLC
jgi:hypothetical protein